MMGARTRFKSNPAWRKRTEEGLNFVAAETLAEYRMPITVSRMYLEDRLGDIQSNESDCIRHETLSFL
jgi:hypothetical protein